MIESIAIELLKVFIEVIVLVSVASLYVDWKNRKKNKNHSLEITIAIHRANNEDGTAIINEAEADRFLILQASNGKYFLGGLPMMKLTPTNEKVKKTSGLKRYKDEVDEISALEYEDAIYFLNKKEIITISEENGYKGLEESRINLRKRGCNSGHYIAIKKKIFGVEKIIAILCIEYIAHTPKFTSEQIMQKCYNEINRIKLRLCQKNDMDLTI